MRYPLALAVTLTVELPMYAGGLRAARLARARPALAVALVVNLATHPLVWLALRNPHGSSWPRFAAAEIAAWLAESLLIVGWVRREREERARRTPHREPSRISEVGFVALLAFTANAASCLAGLLFAVAAAT